MKNKTQVSAILCRVAIFLIFPFSFIFFWGCEVEFSPNAEWKETPVVYCLLDQDEDTTWVRIEKCYLGEGNMRQYSSISDSINYPSGSLQVALLAIRDGRVIDSMAFRDTLRYRDDGDFASGLQPIYYSYTRRRLREDCYYILRVRRATDQSILAEASTALIVSLTGEQAVIQPNSSIPFGFSWKRYCEIKWRTYNNARLYQPIVRFYYTYKYLDGDTHYVDFPCATRLTPPYADTYTIQYSRDAFLAAVAEYFQGDTNTKGYPMMFDIYISMCDENLYAYMHSSSSQNTVDQGGEVYSNISGGLGVFGSRRTHIYRSVPGDDNDREGVGLLPLLKSLDVGFK